MKKFFSILLAAITAAVCISVLPASAAEADAELPVAVANTDENDPFFDTYAEEVAYLVNKQRAAYGLSELKTAPALNSAAQKRAEEIVEYFDHDRPDGRQCFTVLAEYGIFCISAGENIAAGNANPDSVVTGWMHSDGHRENILTSEYQYIGVGVVKVEGVIYWTQMFVRSPRVNDVYTPQRSVRPGDANGDYRVTTADAVAILQHLGNRDKYRLAEENMENADVDGVAGITANDALIIQQLKAGVYNLSDLPLVTV